MPFTFLACSERSGSNLLTAMLNSHPAVCAPPPSHLVRLFVTNQSNYGDLKRCENWRILVSDILMCQASMLGRWESQTSPHDFNVPDCQRSIATALRIVYEREASVSEASTVFVKENQTHSFMDKLRSLFPGCGFTVMVRDPRDVAASWIRTAAMPGGTETAVERWLAEQIATRDALDRLGHSHPVTRISYEELISQPETTISRVVDVMNLEFDPAVLAFHRGRGTIANATRIDAWSNLRRPLMSANSGRFREELSPQDLEFVELSCHDLMLEHGYEPIMVRKMPSDSMTSDRLEALRPQLSPGAEATFQDDEARIRVARRRAIDVVLARRLL
jgi:hypothetical protein